MKKNMGDLKKARGFIIKVKSRDLSGRIMHKSEFCTNDNQKVQNEIRTWMRSLDIKKDVLKQALHRPIPQEDRDIIKEMMQESIEKAKENERNALLL